MLSALWAEVLQIDRVGIFDNFFDLGGHSITATRLVGRVRGSLDVQLPLSDLFDFPTVAALAECIDTRRWAAVGSDARSTGLPVDEGAL
jgi:acyl carrier protein